MKLYVSRNGSKLYTVASDFHRRNDYPYGKWTCADGREVLFNRFYEPIWHRLPGALFARPADAGEWVKGIEKHDYFYDDTVRDRDKLTRGRTALAAWGIDDPHPRKRKP
jgi:hypothetical protein